ncbi:hypothetical protein PV327_005504 [Microctonus hyperodae]|uniref:HTH OST-type domain-containing protein n=1 Tax=Microctonus hyperodae TaxID=165561 RepID=A0AA39KZW8_MICHY|nr:hypothetical protein PV327_005504 [Microctonus hyperodae]
MVNGSGKSLEEVQSVITALLVAEKKKHGIDVVELDQIYKSAECERIPFRALGFTSLVAFLRTVPGIEVLSQNYGHVINFTGKESSKHLSELVARQRSSDSKSRRNRSSSCWRIAPHYISRPRAPSPKRDNIIANEILGIIQRHPKGLLRSEVLRIYLQTHPGSGLDSQKLLYHLRTLESKVMVRESMVYPSRNSSIIRNTTPRSHVAQSNSENKEDGWNSKSVATGGIIPNKYRVVPDSGGEELDCFDEDNLDFVTPSTPMMDNFDGFVPLKNDPNQALSNFNSTSHCREEIIEKNGDLPVESETQEEKKTFNENDFIFSKNQEYIAQLLNERTQFRLEKLIQNNPDGIWCIDLPKKYKEEYNISLDWENLGFQRIGDFAAYLPHIFHMVGPYPNGDFRLYDAKSPLPAQEKKKTEEYPKQTLAGVYNIYNNDDDDEIEAVPSNIPVSLSNQLLPDDVITIGESVGQISVTTFTDKITDKRSLVAVRVVEAFHPSFFWVQIEKKQQKFKDMMNDLHTFYEEKKAKYSVPIIMLEKGLNVACMFFGKWHRGIIKAVDHRCQVTVLFYDYGTLKSYPPDDIFYLHRAFSVLPAQAIPCGLYNVRPYEGDQWPKNVIDSFIKRVYDRPLWATIGKLDVENNTMLISLTDVSQQDYDFHISDWMFEKKMAKQGHMDVNDPTDLSNYVEDYGEDYEVMNQYEINQNPQASKSVIKLPSDISTVTVESLCSALSLLEKKQGIIMTTTDSINNLQNSMQKLIYRHFEMISSMHSVMNETLLINMSEITAKTIMDLVHDTLTIVQPNQKNNSDIVESSTANQQENLQLGDASTNACAKNDNDNVKSIIHHESNDDSKNVTISLNIPLDSESSNQLLLENPTNPPEINQSESLDTNEEKDLSNIVNEVSNDLNIPEAIEINPTDEQQSPCDVPLAEENLCMDISAEKVSDGVTIPTVCESDELGKKCEFNMFITKVSDQLIHSNAAISNESEVKEKSFLNGEDLKETNPFKKYILLNAQNSKEKLISPLSSPSKFETSAQSEYVKSSSDFVHDNNVKIVYQASPVLYGISKKNLGCDSQVETNLSSLEKQNFLNKESECSTDEWQRNHSKRNGELDINRECDDDNGYESGVSSLVVNWLDLQKNEQLSKIDENKAHNDSQVNDKDVTINNNCVATSMNQIILPVQLTYKTVCIISINNEGWITLTEFRSTFTTFGDDNGFHRYIDIALPNIERLILLREDYPELFDRYESWKYYRMRRNQPIGQRQVPEKSKYLSLIRLTSILKILRKMSIITKEEIEIGRIMNQTQSLKLSTAMIDVVKLISSYGSYRKLQSSN